MAIFKFSTFEWLNIKNSYAKIWCIKEKVIVFHLNTKKSILPKKLNFLDQLWTPFLGSGNEIFFWYHLNFDNIFYAEHPHIGLARE